jgi:hypothetical protein
VLALAALAPIAAAVASMHAELSHVCALLSEAPPALKEAALKPIRAGPERRRRATLCTWNAACAGSIPTSSFWSPSPPSPPSACWPGPLCSSPGSPSCSAPRAASARSTGSSRNAHLLYPPLVETLRQAGIVIAILATDGGRLLYPPSRGEGETFGAPALTRATTLDAEMERLERRLSAARPY